MLQFYTGYASEIPDLFLEPDYSRDCLGKALPFPGFCQFWGIAVEWPKRGKLKSEHQSSHCRSDADGSSAGIVYGWELLQHALGMSAGACDRMVLAGAAKTRWDSERSIVTFFLRRSEDAFCRYTGIIVE